MLKGRGTDAAPPNRYDVLHVEPAYADDCPPPEKVATVYYRDASRTILAENRSPDVGFRWSLNPYRGCEHGCVYCVHPDTPILYADMTWRPIGNVRVGDVLLGFDELPVAGSTRKLRHSVVEAVWWSRRSTLRLVTDRCDVITTAEHRWLQARSSRWSPTAALAPGRALRSLPMTAHEPDDDGYRVGLLAGQSSADRTWRMAVIDEEPLVRLVAALGGFGVAAGIRTFAGGPRSVCRPAIVRKRAAPLGREMKFDTESVCAVESGPVSDVVDIQTSTGTFFAGGLATHNCYARPSHEQLGFNAGIDFESRIMVKPDAPELLRKTFLSPRWRPEVVSLSGNTDCYQPAERTLGITRRCLEVFAEFRNPVGVITKSALVARDADLLAELARCGAAHVFSSITSLDAELTARLEPRAARPHRRLEAVAALATARVPVAVMIGPVIPGLNDEEIPRILAAAKAAGATSAAWVLLRLAKPLDDLFVRWLDEHVPEKKSRVLNRIRDTRGGRLNDTTWGVRQRGRGPYAEQIAALFAAAARQHGLDRPLPALRTDAFRRPAIPEPQMRLL